MLDRTYVIAPALTIRVGWATLMRGRSVVFTRSVLSDRPIFGVTMFFIHVLLMLIMLKAAVALKLIIARLGLQWIKVVYAPMTWLGLIIVLGLMCGVMGKW